MKIGFITTINTNIGDDFIRTGIENIILSIKKDKDISYTYVNKHQPETAILNSSLLNKLRNSKEFKTRLRIVGFLEKHYYHLNSVYAMQDLIIQSGAPVLWPGCQHNEWAKPIWYKTLSKLKNRIPIINLAAGSCYPWENQKTFHQDGEAKYASDIGGFCKLTTTRDALAHQLFNSVSITNTLLPCTAFFVDNSFENKEKGEYVLINYMVGSGHFDWGQKIDNKAWEKTIITVIKALKENHEVRFICHDDKEVEIAKKLDSQLKIHYPNNVEEYLQIIKKAKLGINNRMHASVAMASVGVPNISICTDTRLLMLDHIGMPNFYVKDIDELTIIKKANSLIENLFKIREDLFDLKKEKFKAYQEILSPYFE